MKISKNQHKSIYKQYQKGIEISVLAVKYKVSEQLIRIIVKRVGNLYTLSKHISENENQNIYFEYINGKSVKSLSKKYDTSTQHINQIIQVVKNEL